MFSNIRIANVSGGNATYRISASTDETTDRDHRVWAGRVLIQGVEVTTGTEVFLPGDGFEITVDDGIARITR